MAENWQNTYLQHMFESQVSDLSSDFYHFEHRICTAVFHGDLASLKILIEEPTTPYKGHLSDHPLRQEINLGISFVTILAHTAIKAGVHYDLCFALRDQFILMLDQSHDIPSSWSICKDAAFGLCHLVLELKNPRQQYIPGTLPSSPQTKHIEECKDYIFQHLHGKITVQEIAEHLGLEANYLSMLFHQQEGMTLKQFILQEKLLLVQRMLMYSPYSYIEIATYLGFSSQSHMGAEFKKATGMTPGQFRRLYKKKEFQEDPV